MVRVVRRLLIATHSGDTENTVWYRTKKFGQSSKTMTPKDFQKVQRDLEEALSKLRNTNEPDARRELLAEMRRLLAEADRFNQEPK